MPHVRPAKLLIGRKHIGVTHNSTRVLEYLFVHVVADNHISACGIATNLFGAALLLAQIRHDNIHSVLIKPVVRINHFIVVTLSSGQTRINRRAMTAIFFVDGTNNARVLFCQTIGDFSRIVTSGTIVDQNDLNIVTAGQQGINALLHIVSRVIARHRKGDRFHEAAHLTFPFTPSEINLKGTLYPPSALRAKMEHERNITHERNVYDHAHRFDG